jgi:alpha-1,3-rhamnosyl/mannosyltransferase
VSEPLVVVDADVLGRQRTGDEAYVAGLLGELAGGHEGLRLAAVTRSPELVPSGIEALELPARSQILRMTLSLPRLLRRLRPALAHFQYVIPPAYRGPSVVTVHDLSFELEPGLMTTRDRLLFQQLVPRSVRRAVRVFTVSERTKRDLVSLYGIDAAKVEVTPSGVDPIFRPEGTANGGPPYALFVGALQPRKDPAVLVEALALVEGDLRLALVGPEKHGVEEVRQAVTRLGLDQRVDFLGYVEREHLAELYRGAACFVLPSKWEGLGLTVLEAMASGTPVVATTAGALPEVTADAAVLVEPGDAVALAEGIRLALASRERLVAAGLERAREFTWPRMAERTLEVYRELL